eukprot:434482-Prymnesium_polylepis.1
MLAAARVAPFGSVVPLFVALTGRRSQPALCPLASGETLPQRRAAVAAWVRLEPLLLPSKMNCRALHLPPTRAADIVSSSQSTRPV